MSLSRVSRWIMLLPSQNSPPSSSPNPDRYSAQVRLKFTLPSCRRWMRVHPPPPSSMSQYTGTLLLRMSGITGYTPLLVSPWSRWSEQSLLEVVSAEKENKQRIMKFEIIMNTFSHNSVKKNFLSSFKRWI